MGLAKNLRFIKVNIEIDPLLTFDFPPTEFEFEQIKMSLRGPSNKDDLKSVHKLENPDAYEAAQFIYSDRHGFLYDVLMLRDRGSQHITPLVIATRPRPD